MIRLNDEFIPPREDVCPDLSDYEIPDLVQLVEQGRPAEKQRAVLELIAVGAEDELTHCLCSKDPLAAQLATAALWECWMNEEGPEARCEIEAGISLMESGELIAAQKVFSNLSKEYPGWAEPLNKQATVLYRRGRAKTSFDLCQLVVEMKPNHFGAWHGLALCALRMSDWETALEAAREALRLQPSTPAYQEIIQVAKAKLRFR